MKFSLAWWDRLVMPGSTTSTEEQTPAQREQRRRSALISRFLFVIVVLTLLGLPTVLTQASPTVIITTLISYIFYIGAGSFNRARLTMVAGISCIIGLIIGIMSPLLLQGPLNEGTMAIYYLFTITEIIACALLPPGLVFLVAAINCGVMATSLLLQPKTGELAQRIQQTPLEVMIPPILLEVSVAIVMFVLVRNLLKTIRRADRAEEIARLQALLVEEEHKKALQTKQLEEGINKIADVHAQIANGNWHARVLLTEDNVLWSLAIPLNNLLNRIQQWKRDSDLLQQMRDQHKMGVPPTPQPEFVQKKSPSSRLRPIDTPSSHDQTIQSGS